MHQHPFPYLTPNFICAHQLWLTCTVLSFIIMDNISNLAICPFTSRNFPLSPVSRKCAPDLTFSMACIYYYISHLAERNSWFCIHFQVPSHFALSQYRKTPLKGLYIHIYTYTKLPVSLLFFYSIKFNRNKVYLPSQNFSDKISNVVIFLCVAIVPNPDFNWPNSRICHIWPLIPT